MDVERDDACVAQCLGHDESACMRRREGVVLSDARVMRTVKVDFMNSISFLFFLSFLSMYFEKEFHA